MRASLYLVGFAAVAVVGAGMTGVGCSSSSSGTTPGDDASMGTDGSGSSSGAGSSGGDDTGTAADAPAAPCVPTDAGSVATFDSGSAVWACYQAMCKTSLTACAADCACNNGVFKALQCVATDAGSATTCFGTVTAVTTSPNSDLTSCLVSNAACMTATAGDGGPTTDGAPAEAGPVDAGGGG
jgi:hypothetical protein